MPSLVLTEAANARFCKPAFKIKIDASRTPSGPGFPENYLATTNMWTGKLTKVPLAGPALITEGMIFVPGGRW